MKHTPFVGALQDPPFRPSPIVWGPLWSPNQSWTASIKKEKKKGTNLK
jgi:hypothetical protein